MTKFTTKGNYIEICGLALDSENFGFQITSVSFARFATSDSDARVLFTAADNDEYPLKTFEFAASEIDTSDLWYLNCPVSLTSNVKVTGGYISDDHFATLYIANASTGQSLDYVLYPLSEPAGHHPGRLLGLLQPQTLGGDALVVWGNLLFLGLIASLACYVIWNVVVEKLGAVISANYIYLNPLTTCLFSALILGETFSLTAAIGCVAILCGVIWAVKCGVVKAEGPTAAQPSGDSHQ